MSGPGLVESDVQARRSAQDGVYNDLRQAVRTVIALSAIGAILGVVWAAWAPPGPQAQVLGGGEFIADETESFIAGDGRYLVLALVVGVAAAVLAWTDRPHRGPIVLGGLVVGGLAGSLLMEFVGHLSGGGTFHGTRFPGTDVFYTSRLPLSLHIQGLLLIEPAVAVLLYGLLAAFAAADDLGRPDPVRDQLVPLPHWVSPGESIVGTSIGTPAVGVPSIGTGDSVGAGHQAQDGGGHRDAAGPLQQGDLPAEQPREPDEPRG